MIPNTAPHYAELVYTAPAYFYGESPREACTACKTTDEDADWCYEHIVNVTITRPVVAWDEEGEPLVYCPNARRLVHPRESLRREVEGTPFVGKRAYVRAGVDPGKDEERSGLRTLPPSVQEFLKRHQGSVA